MDLDKVIEELRTWWPSETDDFRGLILGILAGLPGGEWLIERGIVPDEVPLFGWPLLGWKEVELLGKLCMVLVDGASVEKVADALLLEEIEAPGA